MIRGLARKVFRVSPSATYDAYLARARTDSEELSPTLRRSQQHGTQVRIRELSLALVAYGALTIAFSWPLVQKLGNSIIGPTRGDNYYSVWSIWWYCQAVGNGQDPAFAPHIFSLGPPAQVFVDGPIDSIVSCPIQLVVGPLVAYNLLVLASFALAGLFTYLLARFYVKSPLAGFVAGFLFSFSSFHFAHALGHIGLLTIQFLPLAAWTVVRLYHAPSWTNAGLCGLGIALVSLSEVYYIPYFLVPFFLVCAASVLLFNRNWPRNRERLGMVVLSLGLALTISLPLLVTSLFAIGPDVRYAMQLQAGIIEQTAVDPLEYILPHPNNPLYGAQTQGLYSRMTSAPYVFEQAVFLGYTMLALAILALLVCRDRRRLVAFWWAMALTGLILALGPTLTILGHKIAPLPFYRLAFGWGPLANFRAPGRIVVLSLLALSVLSASSLGAVLDWSRRYPLFRLLVLATLPALLVGSISESTLSTMPIPITAASVPHVYDAIARDHSPGQVLDLPLSLRDASWQLYVQTIHHHPLVFGYGPRVTFPELESVEGVPYLAQFAYFAPADVRAVVRQQGDIFPVPPFRDVLSEYGIRYVVLHERVDRSMDGTIRRQLETALGQPFYHNATEEVMAWRIPRLPPSLPHATRIRLGNGWLMAPSLRRGKLEHVMLQHGQILVTVAQGEAKTLSFLVTPYFKALTLQIRVNGKIVRTTRVYQPWGTSPVNAGPFALHRGTNVISLSTLEGCTRLAPDPRCYTLAVQQLRLHRG